MRRRRSEPRIAGEEEPVSGEVLFEVADGRELGNGPGDDAGEAVESEQPAEAPATTQPQGLRIDKIVALRFVPRAASLMAAEAVRALRDHGLEHGRYGIFHSYYEDMPGDEPRFSVASLTEPGSFDLERLDEPLAGMSFFMVLPGTGDPVERFDAMVETARSLAHRLDAELFDEGGSTWSIQRERYIREELINYRLQSAAS